MRSGCRSLTIASALLADAVNNTHVIPLRQHINLGILQLIAYLECYQDATTKTGSQSDNDDENLLIYCGSAHLKLIDRVSGLFRDQDHENIDVRGFRPADNSEDACSSNAQAFGYPTRAGLKPGFILVMCQSAFDKSDMDPATNLPKPVAGWREIGDLKLANFNIQAPKVGIDVLEKYLSIKVLHEMMHVGDCIKCRCFPKQV